MNRRLDGSENVPGEVCQLDLLHGIGHADVYPPKS